VAIDAGFKAVSIECGIELVGEVRVVAARPDRVRHARRLPLRASKPCTDTSTSANWMGSRNCRCGKEFVAFRPALAVEPQEVVPG
jgi:hypothetical protein